MKALPYLPGERIQLSTLLLIACVALSVTALAQGGELSPVQLVKDINPGNAGSDATQFVTLDGVAYFRANDGAHGFELWRSDGTEAGTQLVVDLRSGALHGFPDNISAENGSLYFTAFDTAQAVGSKVWRSDGTAAGTLLLVDTYPDLPGGGTPSGPPMPSGFTALNDGTILFSAIDPTSYVEPWKTDGTPAGTTRLKDLHLGQQGSVPVGYTVLGDVAYFGADDSLVDYGDGTATYNRELFRTDGTDWGTYCVKDINPGPSPSIPFGFIRRGEFLYFRAADDVHGAELWRTDGTERGTVLVADIAPGAAGSNPDQFVLATFDRRARGASSKIGTLLFSASDSTRGSELFRSDGTAGRTQLIKDINFSGDSTPLSLTPFNDLVFFNADDGVHGREPWVTDGTEAGTRLFKDLNPGDGISAPMDFTVVGDTLFFVTISPGATDETVKTQLWATDGTAEGTQLVYQEPGSSTGYSIRNLTVVENQLLFTAPNGVGSDGISTNNELFTVSVVGSEAARQRRP